MAEEKTEEHLKLIEDAKELGIKSPHLFGFDALGKKVNEELAGTTSGGDANPIMDSIQKIKDGKADEVVPKDTDSTDEQKDSSPPDLGPGNNVILKEGDGWLYHETEQPRVFKDGEEVPEGWTLENRVNWKVDNSGKFINVNG